MIYKNKKTNKEFNFTVELYENIPVEETYDEDTKQNFKVVEVWDAGIIQRRIMLNEHILLSSKKFCFLVSKEWFDNNYIRV